MRSKFVAGLLAIFLGVLGIHRFYLGQYIRGAMYILIPLIIALIIFYYTNTLDIIKHTSTDINSGIFGIFDTMFLAIYAPVLIIALIDAIIFFSMSKEKFDLKYNSGSDASSNTIVISFLTFAVSMVLFYFIYTQFFMEKKVDVADAEAAFEMPATALAAEFSENEDQAFEKYGEKVVTVQGQVISDEVMIATDERSLILEGEGDYIIKCNFSPSEAETVSGIEIGSRIKVKGLLFDVLNKELILSNTRIIEILP